MDDKKIFLAKLSLIERLHERINNFEDVYRGYDEETAENIIKGKPNFEWIEWECYNCHIRHKSHSYFKGMVIQCSKCWKGNQL